MRRIGTSYDDGRLETLPSGEEEGRFPPSAYKRPDGRILEDVSAALSESPLDASQIDVVVDDGDVTLDGTVPSPEEAKQAEQIVHPIRGVRSVQNRLFVTAPEVRG